MVCNKWTGVVLKVLILSLEYWIILRKKKECIILFYSNVTEGESNRQGPHLICEIRNEALISNGWFYSAPLCLTMHVHIVVCSGEHVFSWRFVLSKPYLLMSLHPASLRSVTQHALFFSLCYPFMCNVLKYLDYIQDMPS